MSTTHKSHVIIRLQSHTPLKPTVARREAVVYENVRPISVPGPAYRWATMSSPIPNHPSAQVSLNVGLYVVPGELIDACEVHWSLKAANVALPKLAAAAIFEIANTGKRCRASLDHRMPLPRMAEAKVHVFGLGAVVTVYQWWEIHVIEVQV